MWHVDGNDKLKKFGFCIHGCIDGLDIQISLCTLSLAAVVHVYYSYSYSRKVLWLKLSSTNNDPRVIVQYFLDTVAERGGMYNLSEFSVNTNT